MLSPVRDPNSEYHENPRLSLRRTDSPWIKTILSNKGGRLYPILCSLVVDRSLDADIFVITAGWSTTRFGWLLPRGSSEVSQIVEGYRLK